MSLLLLVLFALAAPPPETYRLVGVVRNTDQEPVEGALVVAQCTCLAAMREIVTNERGVYVFRDLPPGEYTVQVLYGRADVSRVVRLGPRD